MGRLIKQLTRGVGWFFTICMLPFIIAGCSGTEIGNPDLDSISSNGDVETLNSDEELEAYLKDQYAKNVTNASNIVTDIDLENSPSSDDGGGYSQTNIQETGVDESDMVKTDGAYFYIAGDQSLNVVEISDAMDIVATVSIDGYVRALYLHDNKLIVLYDSPRMDGGPWNSVVVPGGGQLFGVPYWLPIEKKQGVAIYDVSNPGSPTNLKTVEFDGHLASSRLISGKLHIVQQFRPDLPQLEYVYYGGTSEDVERAVNANKEAIADMTLEQLIPFYRVVSDPPDMQLELPAVSADNFYRPASIDGGGTITSIISFDLNDTTLPFESVGMVTDAHIVYASTRALYITSHKYYYQPDRSEEAIIYKFDLTGDDVRFAGGGVVPGWILNQFSLGEYQDVIRVATTIGHAGGWQPTARNNVYCLKLEEGNLQVIGKIEDMAPGEQIYAARFMGERGYLVTFVNIDPLFTLDLSDPNAPEVAGELKVPGYSDYIHPYTDDYLITVGKDAVPVEGENFAWYQGVQLSIFDIRDFSNPVLLHKELIGDRGTRSEALYNHKAFTFWAENDLLALPIDLYEHLSEPDAPSTFGTKTFVGLYVYRLSAQNGFDRLGRISTLPDGGDIASYFSAWTRGIFVDEDIYAVTKDVVRSAPIDQIE